MARSLFTIEEVLGLLAESPVRLDALTTDLAPVQLRTAPAPGEWSANDVLAHLRSCADVWGGCITRILAEDHPTLRAIDPRTWMKQTDYPDLEFRPSLDAFMVQRTELLAVLHPLPPEAWPRGATVTGAGSVLERTVLRYADSLARHERAHLKQLAHIAGTVRG